MITNKRRSLDKYETIENSVDRFLLVDDDVEKKYEFIIRTINHEENYTVVANILGEDFQNFNKHFSKQSAVSDKFQSL